MPLSDLTDTTAATLRSVGTRVMDFMTPTLRLGVTGLARSGKTVFITAFVRNLMTGGRLPFFSAMAEGRIARAYLEPQPDDAIPRFAYEEHLAELGKDPAQWPASTRRISQLRLTIEYQPASRLWRALGSGRVHIDIVDYPGEWLIDLALLDLSFAAWSQQAISSCKARQRHAAASAFLRFMSTLAPTASADEQIALKGADLFTRSLEEARIAEPARVSPGPGRFLLPGDLAGSPLLTFFPLPVGDAGSPARGTLAALLARRFESYKAQVVKPFFRDHFARLDRQIVLIDALSAINGGADALSELEQALEGILECFRPGVNSWLSGILGRRRIDRLLFAATKADHLHHTSHDRLEALLRILVDRAMTRAAFAGAQVKVLALAALRATREAEARKGAERLPCIVGTPLPGQRLDGRVFDGRSEAALFPGDLPADLGDRTGGLASAALAGDPVAFLSFRPPRLDLGGGTGGAGSWPHIRLDRAIDFLIGDRLA